MSETLKALDRGAPAAPTCRRVIVNFGQIDFTNREVQQRLGRAYALLYQYRRLEADQQNKKGELDVPTADGVNPNRA